MLCTFGHLPTPSPSHLVNPRLSIQRISRCTRSLHACCAFQTPDRGQPEGQLRTDDGRIHNVTLKFDNGKLQEEVAHPTPSTPVSGIFSRLRQIFRGPTVQSFAPVMKSTLQPSGPNLGLEGDDGLPDKETFPDQGLPNTTRDSASVDQRDATLSQVMQTSVQSKLPTEQSSNDLAPETSERGGEQARVLQASPRSVSRKGKVVLLRP